MARSLWTGSINFGLVNVPVKAFTAAARDDTTTRKRRPCGSESLLRTPVRKSSKQPTGPRPASTI